MWFISTAIDLHDLEKSKNFNAFKKVVWYLRRVWGDRGSLWTEVLGVFMGIQALRTLFPTPC